MSRPTECALVLAVLSLLCLPAETTASAPDDDASATSAAAIDVEAVRATVMAADESFNQAMRDRDRDALGRLLASDAIFLEGDVLRGKPPFLARMQPMFEAKYALTVDAHNLETWVARSGELAWTIGNAKTSFTRPGLSEETRQGQYLTVWALDGEGQWKIQVYAPLIVHPELGMAREPRSGLMTAWPEIRDQIGAATRLEWTPERDVRAGSGEIAYTFGAYTVAFTHEDEEKTGQGGFVAVWTVDDEGRWQMAGEGYSPPQIH